VGAFVGGHKFGSHTVCTGSPRVHTPRIAGFPLVGPHCSSKVQGSVGALSGEVQVPGDCSRGQSVLVVQDIEVSATQRPQEAEKGGLVGGGVGSTGADVCI